MNKEAESARTAAGPPQRSHVQEGQSSRFVVNERLLRVPEVAAMLRISQRKVWTFIENGTLIKTKLPGIRATTVRLSDVQSLIAASRTMVVTRANADPDRRDVGGVR